MSPAVLGVDACRGGWVGVLLESGVCHAMVGPTVEDVLTTALARADVVTVGVDIPIGLPDIGRRRADELARLAVGPRRSSVFMTPVRAALDAADHAAGNAVNTALAGEGVSVQAFGLRARIAEVEAFVRRAPGPVLEVHPEVCFARMNGAPLTSRKVTWAGAVERRALLVQHGVALPDDLGPAGHGAAMDDVLDAAAVAWTAARFAAGHASSLPDPPEVFSDGWPTAIWV